jgi:photosystem II stability/assembly factor-like uncharacterized protein
MNKTLCLLVFSLGFSCLFGQVLPICESPANGANWKCLGPFSPPPLGPKAVPANTGTGAQMMVKFPNPKAPNPTEFYACTPTAGLFRTRNVRDSVPIWENITDSTRLPILGVRDFEFEPGNPDVIYAASGVRYPLEYERKYGMGILKTTDAGKSWKTTGLSFEQRHGPSPACLDIAVHPSGHDTIFAICEMNLYKSVKAGDSFYLVKTLPHPNVFNWGSTFRDIVFKPADPNTIYLSSDANYFYRSKDGGENWEEINMRDWGVAEEIGRMDIAVSEKNPSLIYLGCVTKTRKEAVVRSLDGGDTWKLVFYKPLNTSYEKHAFEISPNNDQVLYIGGYYVNKLTVSDSTAAAMTIGGGVMHLDHRGFAIVDDGQGHDLLYSANDGGLYVGFEKDKKWQWRDVSGLGFNNMQFYGIGVAEDYSSIPGGTQDLGIMVVYPDSQALKPAVGGDGTDCVVDKYDPNYVYGVTWALHPPKVIRSTDGGTTWAGGIEKGISGIGHPYYFQLSTHDNGYVYAGLQDVFRMPNKGSEWAQLGDIELRTDLPFRLTAMCVAPSDANVIYAYGDQVFKTENGMAAGNAVVWKALGKNIGRAAEPDNYGHPILAIEVDAANPDKVWISFNSNQSEFKVYFSGDGGQTWKNVSRGLPPFPVGALAFQAGTEDALYAGTDVGVFYNPRASDPDSEWLCFNSGLPVCIVSDLEMNYCEGKIVAATFGRGIWESPFASPSDFEAVEIEKDTTWDFAILRSDVVVKKGATLTLKGEIRALPGKKIRVEKNAKLVLDAAHIKDLCGAAWGGVELQEGSSGFFSFIFGKKPGTVELKNGAVVENTSLPGPGH